MARMRKDVNRGLLRRGLAGLALLAAATVVLGALARLALHSGSFDRFDALVGVRTPVSERMRSLAAGISSLAGALFATVISALFAALLLARRRFAESLVQVGSGLSAVIAQDLLREWVGRAPPSDGLGMQTDSFPSSHVFFAMAVYGLFAYFVIRSVRAPGRRLATSLAAALLVGLVAWSRLALGTQQLTDVLGGLVLGLVWVAVGAWVTAYRPPHGRSLNFRRHR